MAYTKIGIFFISCCVFIDAQVIPIRCPKKCGTVNKMVNNVLECSCGGIEPIYSVIGDVKKCGCGKVYIDTTTDMLGSKFPNMDSPVLGILDIITGVVEKKCSCQAPPCTCQVTPCICQGPPCTCQVMTCGCQEIPCRCQVIPSGSQQAIRLPNTYEVLSSIQKPRCDSVGKMVYAPTIDVCNTCSKFDCSCRNSPYEALTSVPGCIGPVDVPTYLYSIKTPIVEVMPLECGCGVGKCGCGLKNCGCGLSKVEPCSCGVVNCGCIGPCICGTGSRGCEIPNCGCLGACGCGVPERRCASSCTCGVTNGVLGPCGCMRSCDCAGSCGCTGSCGCAESCGCVGPNDCRKTECGCRKRSRKSTIPPPFL